MRGHAAHARQTLWRINDALRSLASSMTSGVIADQGYLGAVAATFRRSLPPRYSQPYRATFDQRVQSALRPDLAILDVGAGRQPTVPVADRPPGCTYVGLDVSESELGRAGVGAYDDVVVRDVLERETSLEGRFDLILSWQVLEHVTDLDSAMQNLHSYLRPGGRLIAQFSGGRSAFAIANKALPDRARMWVLTRLVGKDPGRVFPAYYDQCWDSAVRRIMQPWSEHEVVPLYVGAMPYFKFSRLARTAYLAYEEWTYRTDRRNLAAYYVVDAVR